MSLNNYDYNNIYNDLVDKVNRKTHLTITKQDIRDMELKIARRNPDTSFVKNKGPRKCQYEVMHNGHTFSVGYSQELNRIVKFYTKGCK